MSHACPRCHGVAFVAGKPEAAAPLQIALPDGRTVPLQAMVCSDCGFVELLAPQAQAAEPRKDAAAEIQEYDF